MSTAIIITGTICSGKTTVSRKISKCLNIDFLSEENVFPKSLMAILDKIKNCKYPNTVIIEHACILNFINDINSYFDKQIIILLNVCDDILINNLNIRKLNNGVGDYLNVDIFEMKKDIEKQFAKLKDDKITYTADIIENSDYDIEYENIIEFIKQNNGEKET